MNAETRDTTIADLHRIRREMAAKFGGDVFALNADAQARSEASGRRIIRKCEPEKRGAVQLSQQDVENEKRG
jgi:hypothetical protein